METIRDVAPAASSGTLAGVVGYGWRVGRAVARGVVGAAGGWVAWAGRAVGMRCSSASPLHENVLWGKLLLLLELGGRKSNVRAGIGVGTTGGEP